jgi:DNA oxidative demethylase
VPTFTRTTQPPAGLIYTPDFITPAQEQALLERIGAIEFKHFVMQGQAARRLVYHFGVDYRPDVPYKLSKAEPIPDWLQDLQVQLAGLGGVAAEELIQVLIAKYPPGATIGWHRDAPQFGPTVLGVSLRSDAIMRFRQDIDGVKQIYKQVLQARSAYAIAGISRSKWQHSMPPVEDLRYSITFRTVKKGFLPDTMRGTTYDTIASA